jgi:hypothetical protein
MNRPASPQRPSEAVRVARSLRRSLGDCHVPHGFLEFPDANIRNQGASEVESPQRPQIRELFDTGVRDLCLAEVEIRQQLSQ